MARASAVRLRQIELRLDGRRLQGNRFLEFHDRLPHVCWDERRTEIGMSLGVIRMKTYCLPELSCRFVVLIGLRQHQPDIVMCLRVVRTQPDGFMKFRKNFLAVSSLSAQQKPKRVVSVGTRGIFCEHFAQLRDCGIPVGSWQCSRSVQGRFELSEPVVEITRREECNSQIDVGCGRRRQEGNRALKTCPGSGKVSAFAQWSAEKSVGGAGRGIKPHALAQLG